MNSFLLLLQKDLVCTWRCKRAIVGTFSFAFILVVVGSFAFRQIGFGQTELKSVTPGILWLTFLFSGMTILSSSQVYEQEQSALSGLLLHPVDPAAVFLSKWLNNLLVFSLVQVLVVGVHSLLFGAEIFGVVFELTAVSIIWAMGFTAVGTLLSPMAVSSSNREVLLPILLFPLILPHIAAAIILSRELLLDGQLAFSSFWFHFLCGYDSIAVVLGCVLFEFVARD